MRFHIHREGRHMKALSLSRRTRRLGVVLAAPVVALTLLATPAAAIDAGGGVINGQVNFTTPVTPLVNLSTGGVNACTPSAWNYSDFNVAGVSSSLATVVLNSAGVFYWGPVSISASGGSTAECIYLAGGTFNWNASGYNSITTGSLACSGTQGTYLRVAGVVELTAGGLCHVNQWYTDNVSFTVVGTMTPTSAGAGLITPVTTAVFDGTWEL
jgi:hypothetical protein